MDTSKAFDVVSHTCMLNSLYEESVYKTLWSLYDSMYDYITSTVKWRGELAKPFDKKQRIHQGEEDLLG